MLAETPCELFDVLQPHELSQASGSDFLHRLELAQLSMSEPEPSSEPEADVSEADPESKPESDAPESEFIEPESEPLPDSDSEPEPLPESDVEESPAPDSDPMDESEPNPNESEPEGPDPWLDSDPPVGPEPLLLPSESESIPEQSVHKNEGKSSSPSKLTSVTACSLLLLLFSPSDRFVLLEYGFELR